MLSACTVGPAYHSPAPAAPSQAPFVEGGKSPVFTGDQPPGEWWSLFGDPTLDALVRQALAANTDLRVAAANLAQARSEEHTSALQSLMRSSYSVFCLKQTQ